MGARIDRPILSPSAIGQFFRLQSCPMYLQWELLTRGAAADPPRWPVVAYRDEDSGVFGVDVSGWVEADPRHVQPRRRNCVPERAR